MAIYDKPVHALMRDMVIQMGVTPGQIINREDVLLWFAERYPKIKVATLHAHLGRMSTNYLSRAHYSPDPGGADDLFYRIDPTRYRLYDPASDPAPIRKGNVPQEVLDEADTSMPAPSEFAYERDLQMFLNKNLHLIEPGLALYQEEGITGLEYPAGDGRRIDILAVDAKGGLVVVELKVSRGYDRAVGQLLRYMAWIRQNLADGGQEVRGVIVAREIGSDLRLASSMVIGVELFEYELSVSLRKVDVASKK